MVEVGKEVVLASTDVLMGAGLAVGAHESMTNATSRTKMIALFFITELRCIADWSKNSPLPYILIYRVLLEN
jgi:hypothetical protein